MGDRDLVHRLSVLDDIEAIRRLKGNYCLYVDQRDEEAWVSLFIEDAVWESDRFGTHRGRAAIRAFFRGIPDFLSFAVHYVTNPIIEVDGTTATGRWLLLEPCTLTEGGQAVWGAGRYEEEYVKLGDEWKFKRIKLLSSFWTPLEQGWVKRRFAL